MAPQNDPRSAIGTTVSDKANAVTSYDLQFQCYTISLLGIDRSIALRYYIACIEKAYALPSKYSDDSYIVRQVTI